MSIFGLTYCLTWPSKRISVVLGLIQHGEHTGCAFVVAVLFPEKHMVDGHRCLDPVDFQTHPHRTTASFESSI